MSKRKKRPLTREEAHLHVGRVRIGNLNALFGYRYGGGPEDYVFPDDDSGNEDLVILLQHYSRTNPLKVPRIIKRRAPWMGEDEIARVYDHIVAYPRQWKAESLGRLLRVTAVEWRQLRLRTIAPADLTLEERKQERKLRARLRKRQKRRAQGIQSRAEFLAANSVNRTKPWEAEGISRRTWYRRQQNPAPDQWHTSVAHKDSLNAVDGPVPQSKPTGPKKGIDGKNDSAAASVTVSTAEPTRPLRHRGASTSESCESRPMSQPAKMAMRAAA